MAALPQMKLLISLAQIDGKVAERERNYIINIGRANGLYPDEVEPLFDQRHELLIPEGLTDDFKFNYMFSLIQLMKIDERMYKEELMFCAKIASNLGYKPEVLFDLLLHVNSFNMGQNEMADLKALVQKHLNR
jgi:hypothetical protein